MSEDPTADIGQKYDTRPTIATVLERINALDEKLTARLVSFEERMETRIDRVESVVNATRSEMLTLRADFRDFRAEVRERLKETA